MWNKNYMKRNIFFIEFWFHIWTFIESDIMDRIEICKWTIFFNNLSYMFSRPKIFLLLI